MDNEQQSRKSLRVIHRRHEVTENLGVARTTHIIDAEQDE